MWSFSTVFHDLLKRGTRSEPLNPRILVILFQSYRLFFFPLYYIHSFNKYVFVIEVVLINEVTKDLKASVPFQLCSLTGNDRMLMILRATLQNWRTPGNPRWQLSFSLNLLVTHYTLITVKIMPTKEMHFARHILSHLQNQRNCTCSSGPRNSQTFSWDGEVVSEALSPSPWKDSCLSPSGRGCHSQHELTFSILWSKNKVSALVYQTRWGCIGVNNSRQKSLKLGFVTYWAHFVWMYQAMRMITDHIFKGLPGN